MEGRRGAFAPLNFHMLTVNFGTLSKRFNSTKSGGSLTAYSCALKENVSIIDPVFVLNTTSPFGWNYAYCPTFRRYYFIRDIVQIRNNLFEIHCHVDVLATYKSNITRTEAFCVYGQNVDESRILEDPRMSRYLNVNMLRTVVECNWIRTTPDEMTYILTTIGENGAVMYAMHKGSLQAVMGELLSDEWMDGNAKEVAKGAINEIKQYFTSAEDCIGGCIAVPFNATDASGSFEAVKLGRYTCATGGNVITQPTLRFQQTLEVPNYYEKTDPRRRQPFTRYRLFLPAIGLVELGNDDIADSDTIIIEAILDCYTGNITYHLSGVNGIFAVYNVNTAIEIPLTGYQGGLNKIMSIVGGAADLGGMALGLATGNAVMATAGLQGAINDIKGIAKPYHVTGSPQYSGISFSAMQDNNYILTCYYSETPYISKEVCGKPVMGTSLIASMGTFVQCRGARVEISGTQQEMEEISSLLEGGVYLE